MTKQTNKDSVHGNCYPMAKQYETTSFHTPLMFNGHKREC